MITVFHGGVDRIEKPFAKAGRRNLDFGPGFYLTRIQSQTEDWALRASRQQLMPAVVNQYSLDIDVIMSQHRMLRFEHYDANWLHFIVACRCGYDSSVDYDCVEGGVANDRVIDTIEGFINGTTDEAYALAELSRHQPNNQICLLSQSVIDYCLTFVKTL